MPELRRDAMRNRERIVEAARAMASRSEPLALNAVARAADVGVGTIYRHFASVDELEETVVWEKFDALTQMLGSTGPGRLEQALAAHFALLVEDPLFESVTTRAQPALEQTARMRSDLLAKLDELVQRAHADGTLRSDVGAADILLVVCGLAHAARAAALDASSPQAEALLRVLFDGIQVKA